MSILVFGESGQLAREIGRQAGEGALLKRPDWRAGLSDILKELGAAS